MNRMKCLVVLSMLVLFVVAPSLSSVLSPEPLPGVHDRWSSDMVSGTEPVVRPVADTADVAADSLAVDDKKKKKKKRKGEKAETVKLPFWTAYPPAMLGYGIYKGVKLTHDMKKMMKARMEHLRDSLEKMDGVKVGMVDDTLRRTVCPVDTSEALRPAPMVDTEPSAAGPEDDAGKVAIGADSMAPANDRTVVANDSVAPMKNFRIVVPSCRKTSPADVAHCDGTGVCAACAGAKRRYVLSQDGGHFVDCQNCGGTGRCPGCKGKE